MASRDADAQAILRLEEALNLAGSMLCAVSYGVAFTLYCICARSLRRRHRKSGQGKGAVIALVYTTFAMACATVFLGLTHYFIQMSYVFHRNDFADGPLIYEAYKLGSQPPYVTSLVFWAMLDWLTLGIQIWRLGVLWRNSRYFPYVMVPPTGLLIACVGVHLATAVDQTHTLDLVNLNYSYFLGVAFFAIPPVTTILVTALMTLRLSLIRRRHILIMGETDVSKQYTGVISMLIESYALDATWSTATLLTYAFPQSLVSNIFLQSSVNVKIIALFLLVYRVAKGRAWEAHTEGQLTNSHTFRTTTELHSAASWPA
ncbi:hypothetical protein D9756_006688 [Leucocoprinus leucothites]|uniref:Uncharacterized protein n=1 Tax=Leucocoprinus leucothites TaxID=201217 RepID=A0A8H5G1R7_9AGAR|nr:hypothetical protein D9756_006688 [Leucoagaricus leucothites]